ncbi:MAG: acyl-[acyl-carrier-protein]--UDP-N-acetylglucosamine O-acyltransferase [Verrucomicrobiales bacterium]|nr:acyl-[acyl-carrier-protein]--UDP-N-acetylglucosamine O-acyltransferase [Verrucomicrobiales bacterium]
MANEIHPTAIIDPKAELGDDIVIGPYCVIYAGVKIGDGCRLQNHVTIDGPTEIGTGNTFYAYSSIGQRSQDLKYSAEPTYLKIGDNNTFREFCTMNRATAPGDATVIGSHCNFLAYSHVGHDSIVGDHVIFSNNGTLGGHVVVGDYAILGGLAGVHQFCRIGPHAIIGGCAKVVQDIPPFMTADGSPAKVRAINSVGLKRRGYSEESIRSVKKAHRILYREKLNTSEALAALKEIENPTAEVKSIIDFVAATERGLA